MVVNTKARVLALVVVLVMVLAACAAGDSQEPTATRVPPTEPSTIEPTGETPTEAVTEEMTEVADSTAAVEGTAQAVEPTEDLIITPDAEVTETVEATQAVDATEVVEVSTEVATVEADATEAVESTPAADETEVIAAQPVTVWEYISENGNFSALAAAVESAGLTDALNTTDGITLFAPTNDAFEALPPGALDALLADPIALQTVLTYHTLPFEVRSNVLAMAGFVRTLQGEEIAVTVEGDVVILNGTARVTVADVSATNGVIHMIDAVLLPPSLQPESTATPIAEATVEATAEVTVEPTEILEVTPEATAEATEVLEVTPEATAEATEVLEGTPEATAEATDAVEATPEGTAEPTLNTILGVTGADSNFTTFVQAVETAGLTEALSGEGPFIVFVPTNTAFETVPAALLLDSEALNDVLLYHVVEGDADTELVDTLPTLQGSDLIFETGISLTGITVNGVPVIDVLPVDNGVIYVIDQVLTPPADQ